MASLGSSMSLLRRFTPRLSQELFTCRQCLVRNHNYATSSALRNPSGASPLAPAPRRINAPSLTAKYRTPFSQILRRAASDSAAANAAEAETSGKKSSFPKISHRSVAFWLLGSAASVFGIVVFGGLTRLTESGYVIVLELHQGSEATLIQLKSEYHRMAPRHRFPPAYERRRLGIRILKVPRLPRI